MKNRIVCFHLLNNFSGSPNVLSTVINGLTLKDYDITLITSLNNVGFLSEVSCKKKINIPYIFKRNKILRLIQFCKFQMLAALYIFRSYRDDIIYLNTIQPFLPAIIANLRGQKIIYHIHEAYPKESTFTKFLFFIVQITSSKIICVSEYVRDQLNPKSKRKSFVIYNSLSPGFSENQISKVKNKYRKSLLMVSSAREYKGIFEFCKLALTLKQYDFVLVCDATQQENSVLFSNYKNIPNLQFFATQTNLHPFYAQADLILNLSNPNQIIETFGLTIIEGMSYGLPAIVPPVGGIAELVEDNINGFKADVNNTKYLSQCITTILDNDTNYKRMSAKAIQKASEFKSEKQVSQIEKLIDSL